MSNDQKPEGDKFVGAGVVTRSAPERVSVVVVGVLDPALCTVTETRENAPQSAGEADQRVVQYDGSDSTPEQRHYTTLGRLSNYNDGLTVEVEASTGVCRHIREGRYRAYWSRDGRLVLVKPDDIEADGKLAARLSPAASQRTFAGGHSPLPMSRTLVLGVVSVDVSHKHLGRIGQQYTEAFVRFVEKQLREKEFPVAYEFAQANPAGEIRAVRAFGHTVFKTVHMGEDGRLAIEIEAPPEAIAAVQAGTWSLEMVTRLNQVERIPAKDGDPAPPRSLCMPIVGGFRLYEGKVGMSLDLASASIILDAPG